MTFHEWYKTVIAPKLYTEQALYEKESVAFQAIEKLSSDEILQLYQTMTEAELRLALFDHVKNCMVEKWDPDGEPPEFRED